MYSHVSNGWSIAMQGGSKLNLGTKTLSGTGGQVSVSGSVELASSDWIGSCEVPITGAADANITVTGPCTQLNADNSGYLGAWTVKGKAILANALGMGLGASGAVTIDAGGELNVPNGIASVDKSLVFQGGLYCFYGGLDHTGSIVLNGPLALKCDYDSSYLGYTISGPITEINGARQVVLDGDMKKAASLTNPGNLWTGGTAIRNGAALQVTADGGLGTGNVDMTGGMLATDNTGAAVLTAAGDITASRGILSINSTEDVSTKLTLNEYGALRVVGGTTPQTWGTNIILKAGAILDEANIAALPTRADVGGGGQILRGFAGDIGAADSYTVGYSADPAKLYKGLGTSTQGNHTISGTINEAEAGGGFELFAHANTGLFINAPTFNAAGPAKIISDGTVYFDAAWNGANVQLSMAAGKIAYVRNTGSIPAGKTLDVLSGCVMPTSATAIDPTGRVNIHAGAVLHGSGEYPGVTSGIITVKAGGGAFFGADNLADVYTWEKNSQIMNYQGVSNAAAWPVNGNVDYVVYMDSTTGGAAGYVLADDTRLTTAAGCTTGRAAQPITTLGNSVRLSAAAGSTLNVFGSIDLGPTKKLIVGDLEPSFTVMKSDGRSMVSAAQTGTVYIAGGPVHSYGEVDIQSGTLSGYGQYILGGASKLTIRQGAKLYAQQGGESFGSLSCDVYGGGTIQSSSPTRSMGFNAVTVHPGLSVGTLTLDGGYWYVSKQVTGGSGTPEDPYTYKYVKLDVELKTHANVPGQSHDLLQVNNAILGQYSDDLRNLEVQVTLPLPGFTFQPALLGDMAIIQSPDNAIDYGTGVRAVGIDYSTGRTNSHWRFVSDALADQLVQDPNALLLRGQNFEWHAMPGDADLNDTVDYLDLGILAGNYRKSAADWSGADFDFSGTVDYLDLGALAGNYRKTFTPGGEGVPEPGLLSLLVLGAAAMLRRRR